MKWALLLAFVVACGSSSKYQPPRQGDVDQIAVWFMRAALSGDENTARSLTLRYDEIASISKKANQEEWDAAVKETIEGLAREGNDSEPPKVKAVVKERRTLDPAKDEKVLRKVDVAVVAFVVEDQESMPFLFIKSDEGWKFSPKN